MSYFYSFLLLLLTFNTAFGQNAPIIFGAEKQSAENILYKITQNGDSLFLDVFLPVQQSGNKPFPVLLYIHGGAWVEGNKSMSEPYYRKALKEASLKNGFAIVSINYRLLNDSLHFPAPIIDAKDAVRWINENAGRYNFDTQNIGVLGESAGAHLALLVGYSPDSLWKDSKDFQNYSPKVNYVIDNCGPTDLNKLLKTNAGRFTVFLAKLFYPPKLFNLRDKLIQQMTSYQITGNKQKVQESLKAYSPLKYVNENKVPTLIFQGTKDKVVPYNQAERLYKLLQKKGVESELITEKGAEHIFMNLSKDRIDKIIERTIAFMKQSKN
jgi:acetyl esterase/lipase